MEWGIHWRQWKADRLPGPLLQYPLPDWNMQWHAPDPVLAKLTLPQQGGQSGGHEKKKYFVCKCTDEIILVRGYLLNRRLALRGHMTNASIKNRAGILLMPKIDRAHKNYLTPKVWEEKHLRRIFYGTLIFQQSSMICVGHHVGGHTLALQHGGQNYFLLISC